MASARLKDRVTFAVVLSLTLGVGAAPVAAQRATQRDLRAAMRMQPAHVRYLAGDSSAHGDSARRIASLAAWDLEGGDNGRGRRLLREAVARGVSDPEFYADACQYLRMVQAKAELARVQAEAERRFPGRGCPWREPTR